MDIEDDILTELQSLERTIEQERADKEKAQAATEQAEAENQRLLELLKQAGIKP